MEIMVLCYHYRNVGVYLYGLWCSKIYVQFVGEL